jgi:BON domain
MRVRTMVLAGMGVAAIAHMLDPRGRERRNRLLTTTQGLTRGRTAGVERPAPLPRNLAPNPSTEPAPPSAPREPIANTTLEPSRAQAVSAEGVERPAPLPQNVAPSPSTEPAPPSAPREPIANTTLEPSRAQAVSAESPSADVDDAAIVRNVRTRLQERRDLGADDLVVDVVNGVAYLSGDLHDRQTFGEVVDLTRDVPGVRRVQSLLHLPDSETFTRTIAGRRAGDETR